MGAVTVLAGVALAAAAILLMVFFVTESEAADKASNWFFLAFYLFMAWTVREVHQLYETNVSLMWLFTIAALAVLVFQFVTTLLIVLGRLDFRRIALASTLTWIVLLLWMLGISIVIVVEGLLPSALGWLGIGVISFSIVVLAFLTRDRELLQGEKTPSPLTNVAFGLILVGLTTWIIWLGLAPGA